MNDPLNINIQLGNVETSVPLLPEADYLLQVAESTIDPNKDKTGLNWNLKLVTTSPATAVDGRDVAPNFPVFTVCALQAKDDSKDPDAFKRMIAQTIDALFGTDKSNRPDFNRALVDSAVGKQVMAHVFIDDYQENKHNKVKRLKAVA